MLADIVTYDRSARIYRVQVAEDFAEFPAGTIGRRNAYRLAIKMKNPLLVEITNLLATNYPELESRAWKAAVLIVDGKVSLVSDGQNVAFVDGSSEWGAYNISNVDGEFCCDCPDWTGLTAPMTTKGQRLCKHIIAYLFAVVS